MSIKNNFTRYAARCLPQLFTKDKGLDFSSKSTHPKYAKGKSLPQMAEELEEEEESLCPLYDLVTKYPDKTVEELLELYRKDNL